MIKKWTKAEDADLERRVLAGETFEQIAEAIGRTRGGVSSRASRNGFKSPKERGSWSNGKSPVNKKQAVAPVKTNVPGRVSNDKRKPQKFYRAADLLPYFHAKERGLLHVYDRDPHAQMPLVTYELHGSVWVSKSDPSKRFQTISAAVGAVSSV